MEDVTLTVTVHPPAGMEKPELNVRLAAPALAVTVPLQAPLLSAGVAASTRFPGLLGNASTKADDSVIDPALALPKASVRTLLLPGAMLAGL